MTRRRFLAGGSLALGAVLGVRRVGSGAASDLGGTAGSTVPPSSDAPTVSLTESEWRELLTPEQYEVLREDGTEHAFTSELLDEHRLGTFACAGCELALFSSLTKYESGTGWPSFWAPLEDAVGTSEDRSHNRIRTEVHCRRCEGHLGHVFDDGPPPTGLRYCINGVALIFTPTEAATTASTSEAPE